MDALKKLEEIEARVKAATPGPWHPDIQEVRRFRDANDVHGRPMWRAVGPLTEEGNYNAPADAALMLHAPADLALLLKLVRMAVDTTCCGAKTGQACILEPIEVWCVPCRLRRELAGGVR